MQIVFVDTSNYVAIIDRTDDLHGRALAVSVGLERDRAKFVTTEVVLIEFLTYVSARGTAIRATAIEYVNELRRDSAVTIVPQTVALFDSALDLYARRGDKTYSMVDCISMVVCREHKITDVLTADSDFTKEGFTVLL